MLLCVVVSGCRAGDNSATSEYNPTEGTQLIIEDVSGSYCYTLTEAASATQIIFGHDFFPDDISWETVITDPGDVALIKSFLCDLQPLEIHAPPTGGIGHRLSLMLDGVPTSFLISQTSLGLSPDRVDIVQGYPLAEFPANFMSVDWRIWQALLPYDQSSHPSDIRHIMPLMQISHPQQEIFTLGQVFEQSEVSLCSVQRIYISAAGSELAIHDTSELENIWGLLSDIQLTSQDLPEMSWHFELIVHIITADYWVSFSLLDTIIQFFPTRDNYPLVFVGGQGDEARTQLFAMFEPLSAMLYEHFREH